MCFPNDRARKYLPAAVDSPNLSYNSVYETIVCEKSHLRIDVCLNIIDKE